MEAHFTRDDLDRIFPVPPKAFRETEPQLTGFMAPVRFEGSITDLEVIGNIPDSISGTFYRVMPEPHYPSSIENDIARKFPPWYLFTISRVSSGSTAFVRTEKYVKEAEARRALMGKYRNKYTDAIAFQIRSTANTNIVYWDGCLLALKEDSPPYSMEPTTLQTIGLETFDGQLPTLTFTAHPKFDPDTGDMVCFGYETKGDGTPDICYYSFTCPVVAMVHDIAVTKNYIWDIERMKKGGEHWQWDNDFPHTLVEVKWFEAPHGFAGHVANAFENEDGKVELSLVFGKENAFVWWPDKSGRSPAMEEISIDLVKWVIDPKATDLKLPTGEVLVPGGLEFPRIDDRYAMTRHSQTFFSIFKPQLVDLQFIEPRMGGGYPPFNGFARLDTNTGKFTQELMFIPHSQDAPEGEGWFMFLQNNFENMGSELAIVDSNYLSKTVALIKLPIRLRPGIHGNWVDDTDSRHVKI
ncbi:carotenoid oxygenase [Xylogone sp. PMI_703]|nr:carotenoid oxygenase [Xylogone sp. PMI_703]